MTDVSNIFSIGFVASGELSIEGEGIFKYSYLPLENNGNKRTLQGFSTSAKDKMATCANCPYVTYDKFYKYYGAYDYANEWVLAAFEGGATSFTNGDADFSDYGYAGRKGMLCLTRILYFPKPKLINVGCRHNNRGDHEGNRLHGRVDVCYP
jgi:hypothetical protein